MVMASPLLQWFIPQPTANPDIPTSPGGVYVDPYGPANRASDLGYGTTTYTYPPSGIGPPTATPPAASQNTSQNTSQNQVQATTITPGYTPDLTTPKLQFHFPWLLVIIGGAALYVLGGQD